MLDVGRPINTPSNATQGYFPDLVELDVTDSGVFSARGLSPTDYFLTIVSEGHLNHIRPLTLNPGRTLDAGTITLERAIPVDVTYRMLPHPLHPVAQRAPERPQKGSVPDESARSPRRSDLHAECG